MRLVEIVKAQRSEKQYTDSQLRDMRNTNAVFAAGNVAGAGYGGYRAAKHAHKYVHGGHLLNQLRNEANKPGIHPELKEYARGLEREAIPVLRAHKKKALLFGGLTGASTGVAGLNTWKARKAHRQMRERGL
jgi:hypothetical protein